jgi:hypothetical protein
LCFAGVLTQSLCCIAADLGRLAILGRGMPAPNYGLCPIVRVDDGSRGHNVSSALR